MSEDFLKKIKNKKEGKENNPFNKLFENKSKAAEPKEKKEEEAGIEGIENLGNNSSQSKKEFDFSDNETVKPDKTELSESADDSAARKTDDSLSSIPEKDMTKSDIFNDNQEDEGERDLVINTSSSYKNLEFDDHSSNKDNPFSEDIISRITGLLKSNEPSRAIEIIRKTMNE
ncbi:MAG: hypothetical protein SVK54_09335 [candidate division WOR-3 bacterium]|nr:hypothetical protein [candidate division WOR-3 bacterium]